MPHPWKCSQPGWMGSEQPDPVCGILACDHLEQDDLKVPSKLFCDSVSSADLQKGKEGGKDGGRAQRNT